MNTSNVMTCRTAGALRAAIVGDVFVPGDRGYDQARQAWNLAVEERPAAIVVGESAADVVQAVRFARSQQLRIAPQGTGQGAEPLEPLQDAMLLRTARMRRVDIDPATRTARADAGAQRQRHDRRVCDRDMVRSGVRACRALAQHPGQRLPAGVVAVRQQRVMTFSELNDHGVPRAGRVGSPVAVARPAMSPKVGMPRLTAVLRRAACSSSWASLAFAAGRLISRPSASPAQPCCRASPIRAIRLSRMPGRRGRCAVSTRRSGHLMSR
jgi:hypothetical protein